MAFHPRALTAPALKSLVNNLARHVKAHPWPSTPKRAALQELVAGTLGWPTWHAAITAAKANATTPHDPTTQSQADLRAVSMSLELTASESSPDPAQEPPGKQRLAPKAADQPPVPQPCLRPSQPQPLPPIVLELSRSLAGWLESRGGRPIQVIERFEDPIVLSWEEMAAPDGMLAVWIHGVRLAGMMPPGVHMDLWIDYSALCNVQPVLSVHRDDGKPLIAACHRAWEDLEGQSPGAHVDITPWYSGFIGALTAQFRASKE